MQDDAVEETLVDVAIKIDHGHALKEGMDAETYHEACDGMHIIVVAMPGMVEVLVVMLCGFDLFFAAGTVVMAVFGTFGELFEEQLDEKSQHDGGSDLKVEVGRNKAVGLFAKEDVRNQVDEA